MRGLRCRDDHMLHPNERQGIPALPLPERAVRRGEIEHFAALTRKLGTSRAYVSMRVELTFLAPMIQEAILLGTERVPAIQALASPGSEFGVTRSSAGRRWSTGRNSPPRCGANDPLQLSERVPVPC